VPTRSSDSSIPYPSDNQFIEFTNTGFDQDAAQTTVPYIDIQEVVSEPVVPLSGIGVYFKGSDGYAGFQHFLPLAELNNGNLKISPLAICR